MTKPAQLRIKEALQKAMEKRTLGPDYSVNRRKHIEITSYVGRRRSPRSGY